MVLIRNDLLDCLPTPFSEKSSYEIPFAIMFVFQKIHVMHSHLISRSPSAYEMHYAISIIFLYKYITYAYILNFTFTSYVIQQYGSTNTQISPLEQIIISSPMAYTHNYIPYNCNIMLTHQAYALIYLFPLNSSHSFQPISYTPHMDVFGPIQANQGLFLTVPKTEQWAVRGQPTHQTSVPLSGTEFHIHF